MLVRLIRVYATEELMDHMCRHSPQVRRSRVACSITGGLSTKCNDQFSSPLHLRWRSPQRSIIDPPELGKYRFINHFPGIATNAASNDIRRLAYMKPVIVDDLAQWVLLNRRNGGHLTGDGGLVESEEDSAKKGCRLVVRIGLEVRMDIDDESRADGREQTRLWEQVRYSTRTNSE